MKIQFNTIKMSLEEIKIIIDTLRSKRNELSKEIKIWANRYNVKKFRNK